MRKTLSWFLAVALVAVQFNGFSIVRAETLPILISSVQITGGTGKTSHDFVELFNPNEQPVSLEGYSLVKRTATGVSDSLVFSWDSLEAIIPAHGFYLWANDAFSEIGTTPDVLSSATIANDNGIALRKGELNSGELIASISWGSAENGFTKAIAQNPAASKSLSLKNVLNFEQGYEIRDSSPRNSTVIWSEPEPEPLTDLAQCVSNNFPNSISVDSAITGELVIKNNGTSTWLAGDGGYGLKFSELTEVVAISELVAPEQTISITTGNFTEPKNYTLDWQMVNSEGVVFGELCTHNLSVETVSEPPVSDIDNDLVKITEIYANPVGTDSGQEVVEFYNGNNESINIKNWLLDDINSTDIISTNAYRIDADTIISAKGYKAVTIPSGKFALNNSGQEYVSLLDDEEKFIDTVSYSVTMPEGKGYALINGEWFLNSLSLGSANQKDVIPEDETGDEEDTEEDIPEDDSEDSPTTIIISEIYAFPDSKMYKDEFVELYNHGSRPVSLGHFSIHVGDKSKKLADKIVQPGEFTTVEAGELPAQLRNAGQVVKIVTENNIVINEVEYPKSEKGMSYSINLDGEYAWSTIVTRGKINEIVAKALPVPKSSAPAKQIQAVAKPKTALAKTSTVKPSQQNPVSTSVKNSEDAISSTTDQSKTQGAKNKTNGVAGLVLAGLTTVVGAMFALYRSQIL